MSIPAESASSGDVVKESLKIGSRVRADREAKALAKPVLTKREALKKAMRGRQDAEDEVFIAAGEVDGSESRTDRALASFAKKVEGALETDDLPGADHPQYKRLLDDKPPSKVLPAAREERTDALTKLQKRVADRSTPATLRQLAAGLLKAIAEELDAVRVLARSVETFDEAVKAEITLRLGTVVAVRALSGALTNLFAAEPGRVRRLLGQASPGKKRKKKDTVEKPVVAGPTA